MDVSEDGHLDISIDIHQVVVGFARSKIVAIEVEGCGKFFFAAGG